MLQRAARNAYSWWWASHVRTKQSKWLDQNIQDMEEKVEYILKIITEDGDTFAQRAEMYYKKRPEIVNFVEDSFRGFRALAERYDHLSRDLQNANRTIATVFPERALMDEDDDFDSKKFPGTEPSPDEMNLPPEKKPPPTPLNSMPKNASFTKKSAKMPTSLMSKKGLIKLNAAEEGVVSAPASGLSKSEALDKIDNHQKEILAFQTEKEFAQSSYEHGLERYWIFENKITELQAEVSSLQDEFAIGAIIEDDEARTLMTTTALKSCQETLTRLREKQEKSIQDAQEETQKIQDSKEKFRKLKEMFERGSKGTKDESVHQEKVKPEPIQTQIQIQSHQGVESLRKRLKEELHVKSGDSLTMLQLAEKVDDLVDKIIHLESAVSSQTAHVKRLSSEASELQTRVMSLEEEKESLVKGSHGMSKKIEDLEKKLNQVESLNDNIEEKNQNLEAHFVEASCNLDGLSESLLHVKPDDEGAANAADSLGTPSVSTETTVLNQESEIESKGDIFYDNNLDRVLDVERLSPKTSHSAPQSRTQSPERGIDDEDQENKDTLTDLSSANLPTQRYIHHAKSLTQIEKKSNSRSFPAKESSTQAEGFDSPDPVKIRKMYATRRRGGSVDQFELGGVDDNNNQLNWKELFLTGLDDKERLLLQEYESVLKDYKEAKKKLNEVEKKKRASLFQYCIQIKVLKSSNASKDAKIEALEEKLKGSERSPTMEQPRISFIEEDGAIQVINVDKHHNLSIVEERIRTDIDELLEENIEFWMKFSASFHQIQKFQTTVEDLKSELKQVKERQNRQNGNSNRQPPISDIRPIYRHLSEIQTELSLWLDQNALLKEDLENRLASLLSIQEEITRLAHSGSNKAEESELTEYQAAKFHGEILNMKQENNKLDKELCSGLQRVKNLLVGIESTLRGLDAEFGLTSLRPHSGDPNARPRIPLRTFLFGVKLKKQKPSIFACIHPALQKQYSDLPAFV